MKKPDEPVSDKNGGPILTPGQSHHVDDLPAIHLSDASQPGIGSSTKTHPSRRLDVRAGGYGIAAGYEKPYHRDQQRNAPEEYGSLPHSGYYGAGEARRPFRMGQAGFKEELEWYSDQYGRETSGYKEKS